jgi:UDP-2-acetamido-3-amino-2,3-dideoxy-glucuronate N-acetyltransferase
MKKNIAVIGCGSWGKNLIRNFNELKALYAICDIDENKLNSFRAEYPEVVSYQDFNSLLDDPRVDATVISTPAVTHFSLTKKALLSGKDVFVEKPLALHYKEGEELVSLAEQKNKILMVGHVLLYHPAIMKLKNMLDSGELGNILYIYSNRLNLGKFRTEENILWSFAPHDISIILHLLNEMPESVSATGGNYLNDNITDVTVTNLDFSSGVKSHIFVSWLHPYKEQKLVIVGGRKMVMFDDVNPKEKLFVYDHKIDWIDRVPIPRPDEAKPVEIEEKEPLRAECEHFLGCIASRETPLTNGKEGLRVLKILEACQQSLEKNGKTITLKRSKINNCFVHETSQIDEPCEIGEGTKIWHFSHILKDCKIGKNCVIGQNASIGPSVTIGNNVKIQNNVSVYEGVTLEDDVFCGPSMVFTNVVNPRSHWPRKDEFRKTLVKKGASLGANSTILCGSTIGQYAFVGAGAFVDKDIPDYALVYGSPATIKGWMCYCGEKLDMTDALDSEEKAECKNCGRQFKKDGVSVSEVSQ